ncbi:MAG: carotenoid oxygenase family protein [Candidatus Protochlamydia sp.]|nr:carotenoid oxygenase family protein [Candidatus Protochlamydia sp.]
MKIKMLVIPALLLAILLATLSAKITSSPLILQVEQEVTEKPLRVEGEFPGWLKGALVRNSSIPIYQNGKQISHQFDGLAMLHGFAFDQGQVYYTNRFLKSHAYNAVVNEGTTQYYGFASEPSFWQKLKNVFSNSGQWVNNASVNIFKFGDHYVALTEVPLPACFDPKTLDTLGSFEYQDDLPKSKCWESAHPHLDASSNEIVNYLIEFGSQSYYVLYRIKEGFSSREVIAKIPVDSPSYMHSFAMTEHYLILTEYPFIVRPLDLMITNKPFIHHFTWQPEKGTRFIVIDRNSGKVISQAVTDPFFCFHHANAYENENEIIVDLVASPDISHFTSIFPQASTLAQNADWQRRLMRYHLSIEKNEILPEVLLEKEIEFPRFDETLDGKNYRYLYLTISEKSTGLVKMDLLTKEHKTWEVAGYDAIEPVFIPLPNRKKEDEGVILTVIYNEESKQSFLVALEAEGFIEIARAELPWSIPGTFHGQYFSETTFFPREVILK